MAASSPEGFLSALGFRTAARSAIFARPDLLRMESSRSKARRGAAWMWPKGGWPAQHGARGRREVSLVEIATGVHWGAGGTWGAKTNLQICHRSTLVEVHHPKPQRASPGPLVEF
jgi:hypothetical protein